MSRTTFFLIFIAATLFFVSPLQAGTKFRNKDTAKEREDIRFGTGGNNADISIKSDHKSNRITVKPKKKENKENDNVGPIFVVPEIKP